MDTRRTRPRTMADIFGTRVPLIPILAIENVDQAEPLLAALEDAGVAAIEVTLRTPSALAVIERMSRMARSATIGAGTLTCPEHFAQARDAGAQFTVGPALTPMLADAAHAIGLPFVPGVATPTEVLLAREFGFQELKFFPADLSGGTHWLRHVRPLYPDVSFCPTGGISDASVSSYLELDNVFAAGGIYLAPPDLIAAGDWGALRERARQSISIAAAAMAKRNGSPEPTRTR
jgi:2-dehydro-3-deoxyphosphogluconate aldolase / (4S)-4-hydroxy-2-oxoglutarate aldolase